MQTASGVQFTLHYIYMDSLYHDTFRNEVSFDFREVSSVEHLSEASILGGGGGGGGRGQTYRFAPPPPLNNFDNLQNS